MKRITEQEPPPIVEAGNAFVDQRDPMRPRLCRVMAIAEGYAMMRYKGAMPFVTTVKEIAEHIRKGEFQRNDKKPRRITDV